MNECVHHPGVAGTARLRSGVWCCDECTRRIRSRLDAAASRLFGDTPSSEDR